MQSRKAERCCSSVHACLRTSVTHQGSRASSLHLAAESGHGSCFLGRTSLSRTGTAATRRSITHEWTMSPSRSLHPLRQSCPRGRSLLLQPSAKDGRNCERVGLAPVPASKLQLARQFKAPGLPGTTPANSHKKPSWPAEDQVRCAIHCAAARIVPA